VVPLVNSNEEVTLEIAQRNDELGQTFEIAGSQVQSVRTQQIKTSVTVPNKNTVVLGGLITEREESTRNQIPILGDIPLVGFAFSGTRTRNTRKELLLLIQPQIIQGERELFNVNALERSRMRSVDETTDTFIDPELPSNSDLPPETELVPFPAPDPPTIEPALPSNIR
jgi:type II secretory pathway component GspD/PulD (secretin)